MPETRISRWLSGEGVTSGGFTLKPPGRHPLNPTASWESSRRSLLVVAPRTQHALTPRPRLSFACGRLRARSAFLGTITILAAPPGTGASVLIPDPALAVCLARGLVGDVERVVRIGRTTYAAGSFDGRGPAMIRGCLMAYRARTHGSLVIATGRSSLAVSRGRPHPVHAGRMFWLTRKKFSGSYVALICASLA